MVFLFSLGQTLLKQDSEIQDVADERPMKKRRVTFRDEDGMELARYRVASLKERVEKMVAEARDIDSALQELLRETVHIKSNESHEPDTCTY